MKRIAFFGVGMVGVGAHGRGIPSLELLFRNLSSHYEVIVYRLTPGQPKTDLFKLRSVPDWMLPEKIQYGIVIFYFLMDHFRLRFHVINALAVTPAGRIAIFLGRFFNIPVVIHLHAAEAVAFPDFNYGELLIPRLKKIINKVCSQANAITVLSRFQNKLMQQHLSLSGECAVIPMGIDVTEFQFYEKKPEKTLRLLFIGYNEPVKNPGGAIEVFSRINGKMNATLTMIGADLTASLFEEQPQRENREDKVFFLGALPFDEMRSIYESADILLVTSRYESQSSVAIEAMATGVLVCGTHVGILADLSGDACLTVEVGNYQELADQIVQLWQQPERQQQLRLRARKWAVAHDSHWTTLQYKKLLDSVCTEE